MIRRRKRERERVCVCECVFAFVPIWLHRADGWMDGYKAGVRFRCSFVRFRESESESACAITEAGIKWMRGEGKGREGGSWRWCFRKSSLHLKY